MGKTTPKKEKRKGKKKKEVKKANLSHFSLNIRIYYLN